MTFFASLGGEGKGDGVTVGLSKYGFDLVDSVGTVFKFGNVEAFFFLDVLADNLGEYNVLSNAALDGFGDGHGDGHLPGDCDQGDTESLGLIFSSAVLVFSGTIVITVTGRRASGDLHGFGFFLVSHLGGSSRLGGFVLNIVVSTDFSNFSTGGFFTDSSDLVVTVVIVNYIFDSQNDGSDLVSKGWYTNLSIDRGVGVSAVIFGTISIRGSMVVSQSHQRQESQDESLHCDFE